MVVGHTEQKKGYLDFKSYFTAFPELFQLSELAVTFFFVLSGFLITYLIVNDIEKSEFSVKLFYKKRIFRIWPLYYLIIILGLFVIPNIPFMEYHTEYVGNINDVAPSVRENLIISYLLFVPHIAIFFDVVSYLGHTWSIGSEEQFYLVWPILVSLFHKRIVPFCVFFIAAVAAIRLFSLYMDWDTLFAYVNVSRMNAMVTGGFFAMLFRHRERESIGKAFRFLTNQKMELLSIILIFAIFKLNHSLGDNLRHDIFSIVSGVLILNAATSANPIIKLEKSRVLSYLGRISYGIYMYHPIVIGFCLHAIDTYTDMYLASIKSTIFLHVAVLSITAIISAISYEFFESKLITLARTQRKF